MMVHYPLVSDPGIKFHYNNVPSDWLGVLIAPACDADHRELAEEHLFAPLGQS